MCFDQEIKLLKEKREELIKEKRYQHAHETASITLLKLFKLSAIFSMISKDDLKSVIFHIIDINTFQKEIENINKNLSISNETLPRTSIRNLIELSTMYKTKNDTHFQIYLEIPIVSKTFELEEYIPVPVNIGNETGILNENSKYVYFMNNTLGCVFGKRIFDGCVHGHNFTICNTAFLVSLGHRIGCVNNFTFENSLNCSNMRKIEKKNYLIETSKTSTYCFIVKPILLRLQCLDREEMALQS